MKQVYRFMTKVSESSQPTLWASDGQTPELPADHQPVAPFGVDFSRIILCRGATVTAERAAFVERICRCFPRAEILHRPDLAHNRVDFGPADALERHRAGKRTLVFGVLGDAVRFSRESDNACPNYWHFSVYAAR
jgi:hypothetical protein